MARTRQLSDLRTDVLRLADLEHAVSANSPRFTTSEVNEYVNKGLAHVYAEMIVVMDKPFFSSEQQISLTAPVPINGVATFPLPFDFLQILSVGWSGSVGGGPWIPLQPYDDEYERLQLTNAGFYGGLGPRKYGITGGPTAFTQGTIPCAYSIEILPSPSIGSLLKIRYVPTCPRLSNDTDTFDGLLGFEDAACTWAAILMRRKDDLDTVDLERDMLKHNERIHVIAKRRDRSNPPKTSKTRTMGQLGMNRRGGRGWGLF